MGSFLRVALLLTAAAVVSVLSNAGAADSAGGAGTITVSSTAIHRQQGKVLVVVINDPGGASGRLCANIDSNAFVLAPAVLTQFPNGGSPCGDQTSEAVFPEGSYQLTAGVYVGGSQTPEKQVQVTVDVSGDSQVELDGAALSGALFGDVDCNGRVTIGDAQKIARVVIGLTIIQALGCPEIGT
jgi:hypothetical protein